MLLNAFFLNNLIEISTIDSGFRMSKLMINVCELHSNFLNPWYLRTIILNKVQDPVFVIFQRNSFFFYCTKITYLEKEETERLNLFSVTHMLPSIQTNAILFINLLIIIIY